MAVKSGSINRQFQQAWQNDAHKGIGFDKHGYKESLREEGRSFDREARAEMPMTSHARLDDVRQTMWEVAGKMRDSNGEFGTGLRDMDPKVYEAVLADKAANGVTVDSLLQYASRMERVEEMVSRATGEERRDLSSLREYAREHGTENVLRSRAFQDPQAVIGNLQEEKHQVFARLQEGMCARFNGIDGLNRHSFQGTRVDELTGEAVGVVELTGKGKPYTNENVPLAVYNEAREYITFHGQMGVSYKEYLDDLKLACTLAHEEYTGSHAFRHNGIQRNYNGLVAAGHSDVVAMKRASEDAGHHRIDITHTYLR